MIAWIQVDNNDLYKMMTYFILLANNSNNNNNVIKMERKVLENSRIKVLEHISRQTMITLESRKRYLALLLFGKGAMTKILPARNIDNHLESFGYSLPMKKKKR